MLLDLLRNSDKSRHWYIVICIVAGGPLVVEIERLSIPVLVLGRRHRFDISVVFRLARIFRENRIDVVHTHLSADYLWGTLAALVSHTPVNLTTNHSTAHAKTWTRILREKILSFFTDKIVNVSSEAYESLRQRLRLPVEKLELIRNGIDLDRMKPGTVDLRQLKKSLRLHPDRPVVGMVARLSPPKGHIHFLAAAEDLAWEREELQFLIVGDGELREGLEARAAGSAALRGRIVFAGMRRDIPAIMEILDVFVLPSLWEGLPIVLLEAMASGRPIVASAVGGIGEVIRDGENGLLVAPGDAGRLCAAIRRVLDDRSLAGKLARNARKCAEDHYDIRTTAARYERLYRDILAAVEGRSQS